MDTEQIRQIIADVLNIPLEQLGDDTQRSQIPEWDSLQHLNLAVALEQELGIELGPDDFEVMNSIPAIDALVRRKLAERG